MEKEGVGTTRCCWRRHPEVVSSLWCARVTALVHTLCCNQVTGVYTVLYPGHCGVPRCTRVYTLCCNRVTGVYTVLCTQVTVWCTQVYTVWGTWVTGVYPNQRTVLSFKLLHWDHTLTVHSLVALHLTALLLNFTAIFLKKTLSVSLQSTLCTALNLFTFNSSVIQPGRICVKSCTEF